MVLPRGHSGPFGSGPEAGDGVDLEEAEVVPAAVLEFLLAGLGQEQSLAVGAEAGVGDAVLGVDAEEVTTAGRFEECEVPSALEQAAGHDEVLPIRVEGQGLHQPLPALSLMGLIELFAGLPIEGLPPLDPVARHGIAHRTHAAGVETLAIR